MNKKSLLTVLFCILVAAIAFPALAEDKEWQISATTSFFDKYVTTGGFVASPNPAFQPELTIQHKSGFYVYFWDSFDMKTGRLTEADYYLGYRTKLLWDIKLDAGVGYFQLDGISDQFEGFLWLGKTVQFHGDLTFFVKQELPFELQTGRVASWSYAGVKHDFKISERLTLTQQPQFVVYDNFNNEWSTSFAYDLALGYKVTNNLTIGPVFKFRQPISLPSDDCRKTEVAFGGFITYTF